MTAGHQRQELWAKKEIEAIKAQRQRFATEEDTEDTEFYVVRTEDVGPGGRHLVGIESGPYSDLYSAVSHLDKTPSYCPTSMSAELILLSNDARAYQDHSVSSRSGDGCHRFVIKGADKEKAIRSTACGSSKTRRWKRSSTLSSMGSTVSIFNGRWV